MANISQLQNFQGPQSGVNRVPQQQSLAQPVSQTPQFGLAGAENALTTGFRGGIDALGQGSTAAAQSIGQGVTGLNQFAQPGAQASTSRPHFLARLVLMLKLRLLLILPRHLVNSF